MAQYVLYLDSESKWWHPAITTSLCQEKQSYKIKTIDGVIYQKTQEHLKPYTPQNKWPMAQPDHKQPMVQPMEQPHHKQPMKKTNGTTRPQ